MENNIKLSEKDEASAASNTLKQQFSTGFPPIFVKRYVCSSALFTFLVGWHTSVVSLPPGDVIFSLASLPPE